MKRVKNIVLLTIITFFLIHLQGCTTTKSRSEETMPWARPASWQSTQAPGVGF